MYTTRIYLFKVKNKDNRKKLMILFHCLNCQLWTNVATCVSTVDFEQVNSGCYCDYKLNNKTLLIMCLN